MALLLLGSGAVIHACNMYSRACWGQQKANSLNTPNLIGPGSLLLADMQFLGVVSVAINSQTLNLKLQYLTTQQRNTHTAQILWY